MNDSFNLKNPSSSAVSAAKTGHAVAAALSGIAYSLCGAFVLFLLLVTFTPLGQVEFMGHTLGHTTSAMGNSSVIVALICAALLVPLNAVCSKVTMSRTLYEHYQRLVKANSDNGISDPVAEMDWSIDCAFMQQVCNVKFNCNALAGVLAAVTGYLCHDPLLAAVGAPWAFLLNLVIILAAHMLLSAVLFAATSGSFKRKDPELYTAAIELFQSSGK